MKKYILLLALAVLLLESSFGQVTKESYEKAVDLLNCKTVELSLKDDKNLMGFQEKCPCNSSSYIQVNQFLESTDLSATAALSKEIESLKKVFKENWPKDTVIAFLSDDIFADKTKYQKINAFAEKRKGKPEFDSYKASLETNLLNLLETTRQEELSKYESQQTNIENRVTALEQNQNVKEEKPGILGSFSDYLVLLAIVLVILCLFLAIRKRDNYEELLPRILESRRLNDLIHAQSNSLSRGMRNNNSSSSEIRDMQGRIRDLESQINRLNNDIEKLKQPRSSYFSSPSISNQEVRQPEPKTEILFLSTPNSDGSFNESSASNTYKDGASIYKLVKTGISNAIFQIDEKETSIKLALQYPDKNIDPVCDAENAFNPRANRISTIKMGEAELQNGKWIINSKAVIRYED